MPIMNKTKGNCRCQQNDKLSFLNLQRHNMLKVLKILSLSFYGFLFSVAEAGRGELFTHNITAGEGQKNYTTQEEDKLVPHR